MPAATAIETARGKQPLPFGCGHEKSEWAVWKRRESKVAIEDCCFFIRRVDYNGKNRERTGGPNDPLNRISEQKAADSFAANSLITRKAADEGGWNKVVARQAFSNRCCEIPTTLRRGGLFRCAGQD